MFDQEGGKSVADLSPLIELLDFVNNSDDTTFAAELPARLDVDAFATYLAMMDLLENFDDIDGPGNNSYLWWDAASDQFTVVPWDMNLAFGIGMGGGGFPGGGGRGGGFPAGGFPPAASSGDLPSDLPGDLPGDFAGGRPPNGADRPGGGSFPGGGSNPLVERFRENAEFEAIYQERLAELEAELFDGGTAAELLDQLVATLEAQAGDLVSADTISTEADALRARL